MRVNTARTVQSLLMPGSTSSPDHGERSASQEERSPDHHERALRIALRVVGALFVVAFWPLTVLWPSGWAWHGGGDTFYLPMIIGLYATLGVFLLWASREPLRHLGLIWFTVWSSIVHAGIMAVQSLSDGHATMGHLVGDVPALLIFAAVLGLLARRAARSR